MVHGSQVIHHLHKRKRMHVNLEPYPHPDKIKRIMDKLVYVVGILTPIMTSPQVYEIWVKQNAAGVSLLTWSAYALFSLVWATYGFLHKEKPIILMYILQAFIELFIIIGIVIHA
jgi:uncharacterized protein with PQ loop repeat